MAALQDTAYDPENPFLSNIYFLGSCCNASATPALFEVVLDLTRTRAPMSTRVGRSLEMPDQLG